MNQNRPLCKNYRFAQIFASRGGSPIRNLTFALHKLLSRNPLYRPPKAAMAKKLYFLPTFSSPKQRRCDWNVAPSMLHVHQCGEISRHGERGEVSADSLTFPFLQGLVSSHPLFLSGASLPSFGAGRKKVAVATAKFSRHPLFMRHRENVNCKHTPCVCGRRHSAERNILYDIML